MAKSQTRMAKAAIAMLEAGAYYCGGDDGWVFAGRHEDGCSDLVQAGFCTNNPKGLMCYSRVAATLTSNGSAVGKQVYRLNHEGKAYAERMQSENRAR